MRRRIGLLVIATTCAALATLAAALLEAAADLGALGTFLATLVFTTVAVLAAEHASLPDRTGTARGEAPAGPPGAPAGLAPRPEVGTVKWFDRKKGFGFIIRDDGEEVFVHYRGIVGDGRRDLRDGQRVRFVVVERDRGPQAERVVSADDDPAAPRTEVSR